MNKVILNDQILRRSFFYAAADGDIFPFLTFDYDYYVYVDFMCGIKSLLNELSTNYYIKNPDSYEVVSNIRNYQLSDLFNLADVDTSKEVLRKILSEKDIDFLMLNTYARYDHEPVQIVELERKKSKKKCTVIYIHYEGLLTYLLLTRNGQIAPYILCTTVTGFHLQLESIFPLLLRHLEAKPDIWITIDNKNNFYKYNLGEIKWEGACETYDAKIYSDSESIKLNYLNTL